MFLNSLEIEAKLISVKNIIFGFSLLELYVIKHAHISKKKKKK